MMENLIELNDLELCDINGGMSFWDFYAGAQLVAGAMYSFADAYISYSAQTGGAYVIHTQR